MMLAISFRTVQEKKIQQEANSTGCYQLLELSDRYMGVHCTFKVSAQRMSWPD